MSFLPGTPAVPKGRWRSALASACAIALLLAVPVFGFTQLGLMPSALGSADGALSGDPWAFDAPTSTTVKLEAVRDDAKRSLADTKRAEETVTLRDWKYTATSFADQQIWALTNWYLYQFYVGLSTQSQPVNPVFYSTLFSTQFPAWVSVNTQGQTITPQLYTLLYFEFAFSALLYSQGVPPQQVLALQAQQFQINQVVVQLSNASPYR